MNLDYILKEIRKADKIMGRACGYFEEYYLKQNWQFYKLGKETITEADEILSNLEVNIKLWRAVK